MCGEQISSLSNTPFFIGSPPRVRGTGEWVARKVPTSRITPACAGNRCFPTSAKNVPWDHPRVCGEQGGQHAAVVHELGSPPRVRGTDKQGHMARSLERITPACAGNSEQRCSGTIVSADHPRVCGEQVRTIFQMGKRKGSPPRVRGTAGPCAPWSWP